MNNTDLSYSDLSGVPFENQIFNGTNFYSSGLKGTNFKHAVFKNASFKYAYACNKANFDGATMDKVTYAVLKKNKADLTNVTVI
ncbi:pentapeptide repeat-containing protein [uncultured Virgibacillus sp.]|uniref:pentapeptide repeat-containing protein n=1 Tax=Virgibacillus salarius TaxID=447199 RepID=UPI001FE72D0C|nr:pentapeptide repeat-containing protein [Virgibacillus salarius]